ncbi:MAG: carbohydrate kinase [Chloroflexia bacterium]|nr:carbohydrate kinase [Chloroflexia bacterium]
MYLLGYDVGSSSVKASLLDANTGKVVATSHYPKEEAPINALKPGWAEQNPEDWWDYIKNVTAEILLEPSVNPKDIRAIGISYQMHGLVLVDKDQKVLRPSIIWCDSRAATYGDKAFEELGEEKCLSSLLNSPGNFTASKLKWVKENEPEVYAKIDKIMLPGDYIAMKLTGKVQTTASGLSEGILWDFKEGEPADFLMEYYGFNPDIIPEIVPTFSIQAKITSEAAKELRLHEFIEITYRAGDQPNNAFSLNVLQPGEIAATGGTSGVVYGISEEIKYDSRSRVNTFLHVNNTKDHNRYGVLLCINGVGILYSWMKKLTGSVSYPAMNEMVSTVAPGSEGLMVFPFGNGAERVLENANPGASVHGINFNIHSNAHMLRAAVEGIAFAFKYGIEIMKGTGIHPKKIRAGHANLFLSPVFRDVLASITGASIELIETDGAQGAARAAGIGLGIYGSESEAFDGLKTIKTIKPDKELAEFYQPVYERWKELLQKITK